VIAAIVAPIVTVLGIVKTVGPVWPTAPSFSPGLPSFGAAIDIPFTIENRSALFPIKNLEITCVVTVSFLGSPDGLAPQLNNLGVRARGLPASLASATSGGFSSGAYLCPLRDAKIGFGSANAADRIKSAQLSFHTEYDAVLPWQSRSVSDEGPFTLVTTVPQYWVKGTPLK
jgi:hypothetical protein